MELLPQFFNSDRCSSEGAVKIAGLAVELVECHKYTTIIRLTQPLPIIHPLAPHPEMVVRIYHDARVAEVLSYQHHRRFLPRYDYPNPGMCQRREKRRVNEFLGEWLRFCLAREGWRAVKAL